MRNSKLSAVLASLLAVVMLIAMMPVVSFASEVVTIDIYAGTEYLVDDFLKTTDPELQDAIEDAIEAIFDLEYLDSDTVVPADVSDVDADYLRSLTTSGVVTLSAGFPAIVDADLFEVTADMNMNALISDFDYYLTYSGLIPECVITFNFGEGGEVNFALHGKAIAEIETIADPTNMSYAPGETIDISGMKVKVSYADGDFLTVTPVDFAAYGIATNPVNGSEATAAISGRRIMVLCTKLPYAPSYTANKVAVNCVGDHTYGEWEVVYEATCIIDGYTARTCALCGHTEGEVIAATGHIDEKINSDGTEGSDEICDVCDLEMGDTLGSFTQYLETIFNVFTGLISALFSSLGGLIGGGGSTPE